MRRVMLAVGLGLAAAGGASGEPIRFSKPFIALAAPAKPPGKLSVPRPEDRELFKMEMDAAHISKPLVGAAAPPKEPEQLPAPRERGLDFSAPDIAPPVTPRVQQPIRRMEPRDQQRDDTPLMLRTPKIFMDPYEDKAGQKNTANSFAPGHGAAHPAWPGNTSDRQRADATRALSPVTDFDWDAHDSRSRPKDSAWDGKSTTRDRSDARTRSPFATREDSSTRLDGTRSDGASDLFGSRTKEKLSAARLQRDADFQQLLNPNAGAAAKMPSSLEPVVSAASATPATLAMPTIGGTRLPGSGEPLAGFKQPREQPRGTSFEGYDKKNSTAPAPAPSFLDPRYQPPLNRQPTIHEFPTRKF